MTQTPEPSSDDEKLIAFRADQVLESLAEDRGTCFTEAVPDAVVASAAAHGPTTQQRIDAIVRENGDLLERLRDG